MHADEMQRVASGMAASGFALSSFERLGVELDPDAAAAIIAALADSEDIPDLFDPERRGMVMFHGEKEIGIARSFMAPLMEGLVRDRPGPPVTWFTGNVNYYLTGDFLGPHHDDIDATVVIASLSGTREFSVFAEEAEEDVFREVVATYRLTAGSVMFMDGYRNIAHTARCVEGPSISVASEAHCVLFDADGLATSQRPQREAGA